MSRGALIGTFLAQQLAGVINYGRMRNLNQPKICAIDTLPGVAAII